MTTQGKSIEDFMSLSTDKKLDYLNVDDAYELEISHEMIRLGQALKLADFIEHGHEAKDFLASHNIKVNAQEESRRGCQLFDGYIISFDTHDTDNQFLTVATIIRAQSASEEKK